LIGPVAAQEEGDAVMHAGKDQGYGTGLYTDGAFAADAVSNDNTVAGSGRGKLVDGGLEFFTEQLRVVV